LILSDLDRLREIAKSAGKFQIIYAGKAHPNDGRRKRTHQENFQSQKSSQESVHTVFLDTTTWKSAKITAGVDLWLNTPQFLSKPRAPAA